MAFSPTDIRKDGKFHPLKIALAEKERGFNIQARHGYFAFKEGEAAPESAAEVGNKTEPVDTAISPEAQEQQKIREAVISKADLQQLPVTLDVKLPTGQADMREVRYRLTSGPRFFLLEKGRTEPQHGDIRLRCLR